MEETNTNIFCVMGKPGSGRYSIILNMLARKEFIKKYGISKLICYTTKPMTKSEIKTKKFISVSKKEYDRINNEEPDRIIDSRSVDDIVSNEIYYNFILKDSIHFGENYIGELSINQYNELKIWAQKMKLKKNAKINIYPIMVTASIFERERRMRMNASTELDIYNMCSSLILEPYEFSPTNMKNSCEILDIMNPNTCVLNNNKNNIDNIDKLGDKLEKFIISRLESSQGN